MAVTSALTGKQGSISVNSNVLNITSWTCKTEVDFADSTDSGGFQSGSNRLPKSQLGGADQASGALKGWYDLNTTSADLVALVKNPAGGPWALILKLNTSTTHFNGNADLTDFETGVTVPGSNVVEFTCNYKSNGNY